MHLASAPPASERLASECFGHAPAEPLVERVASYSPTEHASPASLRRDQWGLRLGEPLDRHANSLALSQASLLPLVPLGPRNYEPFPAFLALLPVKSVLKEVLHHEWTPLRQRDPSDLPGHSAALASSPEYLSWRLEFDSVEVAVSTTHTQLPQSSLHK